MILKYTHTQRKPQNVQAERHNSTFQYQTVFGFVPTIRYKLGSQCLSDAIMIFNKCFTSISVLSQPICIAFGLTKGRKLLILDRISIISLLWIPIRTQATITWKSYETNSCWIYSLFFSLWFTHFFLINVEIAIVMKKITTKITFEHAFSSCKHGIKFWAARVVRFKY